MTMLRQDGSVEFRFFRPDVGEVRIAGDFDGWTGRSVVMEHQGEGWWSAVVRFAAGEYRFRYIADGQWYTDYAAHGIEMTAMGTNSVLVVPKGKANTISLGNMVSKVAA